ncbi:MAG: Mrp/NBP35 family ATP-binding protein, partial [Muribaculaceae bacterium]|nr:Mrp/NBP35 family ATP-binding protein [Muribaculaceae bacterium]
FFGAYWANMFGLHHALLFMHEADGRDLIIPAEKFGVKLLSIGFMVDPAKPVLWRGSMASNALNQLITQADWGELDYFLIDMPPGTSDIHLTLVQTLGITGAVIVSTPQQVALADARKGVAMFLDPKVNVPVLGIVENMAWFTPAPHPDERYYIFGRDGAAELAAELGVKLLGQIPVVADICTRADNGEPIALADSPEGVAFLSLAAQVNEAVKQRNSDLPPTEKVELKH